MTRFFDVLFATCAIVVLFPFMIPIMIGLKLTGEHYVFYEQMRVGKGGKEFALLKFATMLKDSPNLPGGMYTMRDDPRILPMGKFLRRTKINELPQLINILRGDMSIIGYRPTVMSQYEDYPDDARKKMATSLPGLSGIGSIVFRNEEEMLQEASDNEEGKEKFYSGIISPYKAALECWYIDHKSIFMYFRLIALTVDAVRNPKSRRWWRELKRKGLPKPPRELRKYL